MSYKDFTQLPVWQKAHKLLVEIYRVTEAFPLTEKFGMSSDMRRSANSISHNFSEGFGRFERKDKSRFYKISRGSAYEIISQTITSHVLRYLSQPEHDFIIQLSKEVIDDLDKIIKTVETKP